MRRRGVTQTINLTFERGVANGFSHMKLDAKTAVLHNLHTKFGIRRQEYTRCLHGERLFDTYEFNDLWTRVKQHQGLGARISI